MDAAGELKPAAPFRARLAKGADTLFAEVDGSWRWGGLADGRRACFGKFRIPDGRRLALGGGYAFPGLSRGPVAVTLIAVVADQAGGATAYFRGEGR
jgi:hypothetical protein